VADLLTHVLVVYALGRLAVWRGVLPGPLLPVVLLGAVAPDAMKVTLLLGVLWGEIGGVRYSAWGYHTVGGVLGVAGIGALTVRAVDRRSVFGALVAGGLSHLLLDTLVIRADGVAPPYLFPFTTWLPPAGNVYLSSDRWPAAVALTAAVAVWLLTRRDRD
jgi:hypothetical protein